MAALHTHLAKALERRSKAIAKHKTDTHRAAELRHNRHNAAATAAAAATIPQSPHTPSKPGGMTT